MKVLALASITFLTTIFVNGQQPPPVADNANPQDRSIKDRSIDLERTRRDENKGVVTGKPGESMAESKFNQIKEDFEQIQVTQSAIVAAYQKPGKIDYVLIATGAEQISKRGTRLKDNLFAPPPPSKEEKKKKDKDKKAESPSEPEAPARPVPTDIKTLVAEIDNTLAMFVSNAMFSNARTVNADDHARAKSDLEYVIALGSKLHELARAQAATTN